MDCSNCEYDYTCCKEYGATLTKEEFESDIFKVRKNLVPLTENSLVLGYVFALIKENGRCVFFNENKNLCNIYDNRPSACRNFSCAGRI